MKITKKNLKRFIKVEIPFSKLKIDQGILESNSIDGISVGVSFEKNDEENEVYIYNLFDYGQYVNISGNGTKQDILPDTILSEIESEWKRISIANNK